MIKVGDIIQIDTDDWADCGKRYYIIGYEFNYDTTGVRLKMYEVGGDSDSIVHRVVASHQILKVN